jgi:adenylate cyclase class IV
VIKLLGSLSARFVGVDEQTNVYFEIDKRKMKPRVGTIEKLITHCH